MNPLICKLRFGADLDDADEQKLETVCADPHFYERHHDLIREGDRPEDVHLVLSGLACRYKLLANGRRQIVALLVPGDFCDLHVAVLGAMDHCISTLTPSKIVDIPRSTIEDITTNHPRILRGLWWATLVDEAVLREWLVGMGQRQSNHQMAHFFCEMFVRLGIVDLTDGDSYDLPLTQVELGDTLGLSTVHINRTLQQLRAIDLVHFDGGKVKIPNVERLFAYCRFSPNYLHLVKRKLPAI